MTYWRSQCFLQNQLMAMVSRDIGSLTRCDLRQQVKSHRTVTGETPVPPLLQHECRMPRRSVRFLTGAALFNSSRARRPHSPAHSRHLPKHAAISADTDSSADVLAAPRSLLPTQRLELNPPWQRSNERPGAEHVHRKARPLRQWLEC